MPRKILLLDADDAGRAAARAWWKAAQGVAAQVLVAKLPEGRDVSDGILWKGTDHDLMDLMSWLNRESAFVPTLRGTRVAGWHEDSFVFPGLVIGARGWQYVPPVADVSVGRHLRRLCRDDDWSQDLPAMLVALHGSDIHDTHPRLARGSAAARHWMRHARAVPGPRDRGWCGHRQDHDRETIPRAFGLGGEDPRAFTATTPHGVMSTVQSTKAIPVWFDEFRKGARRETRDTFVQVIRDWNQNTALKGGLEDQRQAVTALPALAPIVVTGEDAFSERSHAERMVIVRTARRSQRRSVE